MKRKKPVWTKAMRQQAALHGARQSRESRQYAGLMAWHGKTPEEQAATVARLREHRQTGQTNASKEAKAAQRARALAGMAEMTAKKAQFLADKGMLRKVPTEPAAPMYAAPATPDTTVTVGEAEIARAVLDEAGRLALLRATKPNREDYPDRAAWTAAMKMWAAAQKA